MLGQEAVNAAGQIVVALIIALVVWLIFGRKRAGFFSYTGLTLPTGRSMTVTLVTALIIIPATLSAMYFTGTLDWAGAENTVAGMLRPLGLSGETAGMILIIAFLKTGLSEEILFRGVFAKRLIGALGFWSGNLIHAAIFGAIHLLIFVVPGGPAFTPVLGAVFFGVPAVGGFVMAWLNERVGNGSIAPGWLLHGLTNAISYPVVAFWL